MPFHMPGHKRNTAMLDGALPFALDITEIDGFDNLQNPTGILRDLSRRAADLWGSRAAYISVNGSTGAILAGIRAMTKPNDTVLVARNCHMSVFHALELCFLRPVLLEPEWNGDFGIYDAITQETFDATLASAPQAVLAIVTSPTYEGVETRIRSNIPLLIDAAHGAHLPLPNGDIVVHSLHKTLPALTQTALLHVCSNKIDMRKLEHQLRVFQTSSPSYILMASIDRCVALLEQRKQELFAAWASRLDVFYANAAHWTSLRLFAAPHDRSKLLIACADANALAAHLRAAALEPEYAHGQLVLLMTSPCDTLDMMRKLTEVLNDFDAKKSSFVKIKKTQKPPAALLRQFPAEAIHAPHETILINDAIGRVSAKYAWLYPPGAPVLLPGQEITSDLAAFLHNHGAALHGDRPFPQVDVLC